jgi:hypothetical protein
MKLKSDSILKYFNKTNKKYLFIHKEYDDLYFDFLTFDEYINFMNELYLNHLYYIYEKSSIKNSLCEFIDDTYIERFGFVEVIYDIVGYQLYWFYSLYNEEYYDSKILKNIELFDDNNMLSIIENNHKNIILGKMNSYIRNRKLEKII